jgi:hypothetical protein
MPLCIETISRQKIGYSYYGAPRYTRIKENYETRIRRVYRYDAYKYRIPDAEIDDMEFYKGVRISSEKTTTPYNNLDPLNDSATYRNLV